jgi:hypothetical protein
MRAVHWSATCFVARSTPLAGLVLAGWLLAGPACRAAIFDFTHTSGTVTANFTGTAVLLSISGTNTLSVPSTAAQDLVVRNGVATWSSGTTIHSYVFDQTRSQWKGASTGQGPTSDLGSSEGVVAWSVQNGSMVFFRVYDPIVGNWVGGSGSGVSGVIVINRDGVVAWRTGARVNFQVYDPTRSPGWRAGGVNTTGGFDLQNDDGVVAWSSNPRVDYQVYDPRRGQWMGGAVADSGFTANLLIQNSQVTWTSAGKPPFVRGYNPNTGQWGDAPLPAPYFAVSTNAGNAPVVVSFIDMSIGGTSWSLNPGDGTATVFKRGHTHRYAAFGRFTATQTVNGLSTNRIILTDTVAPVGTNRINQGAAFTTNALVTLTLTASDNSGAVADMRFSNEGTNWSNWESYAGTKAWLLPTNTGLRSVSAQFRDAALNTSATATASIQLDTSPLPVASLVNTNVSEDAGTVTLFVNLDRAYSQPVALSYTTSNGTAVAGSDYDAKTGALTFPANTRSTSFTLAIRNDTLVELNETVLIHFTALSNAIAAAPGVVTILDNDFPFASFVQTNYSVNESISNGAAAIAIQLSAASGKTVSVGYVATNGTATADLDYAPVSGVLVFPPGVTNLSFIIPIINDPLDELPETVTLALLAATNAVLATPTNATLTLIDDDNPVAYFSASSYTVTENAGLAEVRVFLSKPFSRPARVRYSTTTGGTAIPGFGNDYLAVSDDIEFSTDPTSEESTNQFLYVNLVNDGTPEPIKTIRLRLSNFRDASPGPRIEADIVLIDDDAPPQLTLPTLATNHQFQVTLRGKPGQRFAIEHSPDLVNWTELTTLINPTGTLEYSLPVSASPPRGFLRTRLVP